MLYMTLYTSWTWMSQYRILGKNWTSKNASIPSILDCHFQERTPGVGEEGDGRREERAKLEERMAAIEADLDKACQEEDYDKAGESAILPAWTTC